MKRKKLYPKIKEAPCDKSVKRHTHSVIAGLEDAISLLWEIVDDSARFILQMRTRLERVITILKITRAGPHAYDARNLTKKEKENLL